MLAISLREVQRIPDQITTSLVELRVSVRKDPTVQKGLQIQHPALLEPMGMYTEYEKNL